MADFPELPTKDGLYLRDAVGGEIKDVDDANHTVVAVFPHDTVDTFKTTFDKDAFRESFQKRMPLMAWQHDLRDPIGHSISAQVLPNHNEIVGQFDDFDAVPNSKRAFHQIRSGTITDFSFGFRQPQYEKHRRHVGVRNIRSAIMMEFSPVSVGSIPGAIATGVREEEIVMAEHSAAEIQGLVTAQVISPEEGRAMLAQIDGYRDVVRLRSPEQARIAELEAQLATRDAPAPVEVVTQETIDAKIAELEAALTEASTRGEATAQYEVPAVINAEVILGALPEALQRSLIDQNAVLAVAPEGTQFFRDDDPEADENAGMIAGAIAAAHASALDWIKDTDRAGLPDEVQQALLLVDAAATSTRALLEVLGVEERASSSPYTEPGNPAGSENMGPTHVKCLTCAGKGETEDGKTCPDCDGSGDVAVTRAEPDETKNTVDDIPEGAVKCTMCKGTGELANHAACPICKGKGWMKSAKAMAHRADPSTWSDKPWGDFSQADYSTEEWKDACLIVEGDGTRKADCKLPVKEPDGTYNRHAIAAAAARLNQVEGSGKREAAHELASLYRQLGEELPPEVEKLTRDVSSDGFDDQVEAKRKKAQALARLNKHAKGGHAGKGEPTGGHPDLDTESVEGMPDPVNHAP